MTFVGVPAVIGSADVLLVTAHRLIDGETAALEADPNVTVSCRPNCNACCRHAVVVTAAEHRAIAAAVAELPADTQHVIASRAEQVLRRVTSTLAADAPATAAFDPATFDPATFDPAIVDRAFLKGYYALQEPCPLLIDGRCSVRPVRPLVCREYLMSSAPEHCSDVALDKAVKIRRRRDVSGGFQKVSARFDGPVPQLLPLALLQPPEPVNPQPKSGPKLARLLTSH